MNDLVLNIEKVKTMIDSTDYKFIVLDFNNRFSEYPLNNFYLDKVNPAIGNIDVDHAKALNAALLHNSNCLYSKCLEVLDDPNFQDGNGVIEEAMIRLHGAWEPKDNTYVKQLSQKIVFRNNKNHLSVDNLVEETLGLNKIFLKAKGIRTHRARAITYIYLSKMCKLMDKPFLVFCDDVKNIFQLGNTKLFLETINSEKCKFVFSNSKETDIPDVLLNYIYSKNSILL